MVDDAAVRSAALAAIEQIDKSIKAPEPAKTEPAQAPQRQQCPCCNWDLRNMSVPLPGEEEKKEYVRCLLGKRRFSKTYSLFDGAITLKYQMLTSKDSALMSRALKTINDTDVVTRTTKALKIKLLFYFTQFNGDTFDIPVVKEEDSADEYAFWADLYEQRFGDYAEDIPIVITRIFMEFHRLAEMLPSAGLDANFWKGAGLA